MANYQGFTKFQNLESSSSAENQEQEKQWHGRVWRAGHRVTLSRREGTIKDRREGRKDKGEGHIMARGVD